MMKNRFNTLLAIIFSVFWAMPFAQAMSLGTINVNSALNEPLDAEIPVYSTDAGEILNAYIALASLDVHKQAGIELNNSLSKISFRAVQKVGGKFVIQLKTRRPIREPVLEFIIEVSGGAGYLRRGYAIHLDPPAL